MWCELPRYVARQLSVYGQSKILLLHDVDALGADSLSPQQVACDVACLVYDATDEHSFEHVARLYLKVSYLYFIVKDVFLTFISQSSTLLRRRSLF